MKMVKCRDGIDIFLYYCRYLRALVYKNLPSLLVFFHQRLNLTSNKKYRNNLEKNVCVVDENNIWSMLIIKERRMQSYHNCEKQISARNGTWN